MKIIVSRDKTHCIIIYIYIYIYICFEGFLLPPNSTVKLEALYFSETSVLLR
jgi:hypothetical protein